MRGVVFTEFLDMVEARFGMDVVDRIIEGAETRTGGAYTSAFFVEVPYIHIEVKKLYPDAELPGFNYERPDERTLVMHYRSPRGLADLAHGLIDGCIAYFGQPVSVAREDRSGGRGQDVVFTLTKG